VIDRRALAAQALAQIVAEARAKGIFPERHGSISPGSASSPRSPGHEASGHLPGGRPRRDDPDLLQSAIGGLLDENGWRQRAAMGSVFGRWTDIVGAEVAAHTSPDSYADGELTVVADSTAWATQVRLLAPMLVKRLNTEVGDGSVRRVKVRGPQPPKRRGGLRVPGSKGPGDTYG
jgi:predicted nucleic acid-binding Zn ribbon protein